MIRELKNGGAVNPGNSKKTRPTSAMPMPMPCCLLGRSPEKNPKPIIVVCTATAMISVPTAVGSST